MWCMLGGGINTMIIKDRIELRRKISAIIWGCDTRDASYIASKIVDLLEKEELTDWCATDVNLTYVQQFQLRMVNASVAGENIRNEILL